MDDCLHYQSRCKGLTGIGHSFTVVFAQLYSTRFCVQGNSVVSVSINSITAFPSLYQSVLIQSQLSLLCSTVLLCWLSFQMHYRDHWHQIEIMSQMFWVFFFTVLYAVQIVVCKTKFQVGFAFST